MFLNPSLCFDLSKQNINKIRANSAFLLAKVKNVVNHLMHPIFDTFLNIIIEVFAYMGITDQYHKLSNTEKCTINKNEEKITFLYFLLSICKNENH